MKKRILTLFMSACITISAFQVPMMAQAEKDDVYWPKGPKVDSSSAIVMEVNTGTILYKKKIHDKHYPASITKIMTTLLAVEQCDLTETVTFSHDAAFNTTGTKIARDEGEEMSLEDTLYAVMLGSANECAHATAEHVAGDLETFAGMMNDRAKALGCKNTHFNNPHGLPDTNHYTSAYDMALIARQAIQNEKFKTITGTKKYTIPPTNKHKEETPLVNHHGMLTYYKTGKYIYEDCIGGKTGYTNAARHTLVTYAERNGMVLVCVVMETSFDGQYQDTTKLLDFCFDNYQMLNVADNDKNYNTEMISESVNFAPATPFLAIDDQAMIILPKMASFSDVTSQVRPDSASDGVAAVVEYEYADHVVGEARILYTGEQPEEYKFGNKKEEQIVETKKVFEVDFTMIFKIVLGILLAVGLIILIIYVRRNIYLIRYAIRTRREKRRREITFRGKRRKRRRNLRQRRRKD